MIGIIRADGVAEVKAISLMKDRAEQIGEGIENSVSSIMKDIKNRGYAAVSEYSLRFDGVEPREVTADEIAKAYESCPQSLIEALERAADNIRAYQEKLMTKSSFWTDSRGAMLGSVVRGIDKLGIYVPGGTAAYPSSVLMNAIPARVAGVQEIIMLTPPTKHLSAAVLAAAKIASVDRVIALGGAQAVGAVTYGAKFIPKVDKLVGPGNAYVAAAKRMAYGLIDIDMVAGPSEVLVIADQSANPAYVAADLISQAEHDVLASAILVTDSEELALQVNKELKRQTDTLSRKDIIERSLRDFGAIIVTKTIDRALEIANEIAPEHLEIMTRSPKDLLPKIQNAGAVFLGEYSPEPLGDYMAGPSHVLPTSGTARFFSPLSVDSFLKKMSVIDYTEEALRIVADDIISIAETEELTAHANSVKIRFGNG